MSKARIIEVATRVRQWAEQSNRERPKPFDNDLAGMCAIAAAKLFTELTNEGIKAKLVANDNHCFVQVRDMIIDVTATQFRGERVLAIRRHILEKRPNKVWWEPKYRFANTQELRAYQIKSGWPCHQTICQD